MNPFKITLNLILAICVAFCIPMLSANVIAQDAPAKSKKQEKDSDKDSKKTDSKKKDNDTSDQDDEDDKSGDKDKDDDKDKEKDDDKDDKDDEKPKAKSGFPFTSGLFNNDNKRVSSFSKKSKKLLALFDDVVDPIKDSTVRVMNKKGQIALGTVISKDGLILTKASQLSGEVTCKLPNGDKEKAKVIGIHPETDLALLKIEAEDLTPVKWNEEAPVTGRWVASPKAEKGKTAVGVVSVDARKIPPSRPFIGITMENLMETGPDGKPTSSHRGIRITSIVAKSPADKADLWVNDMILTIDEVPAKDILSLQKALGQYDVFDRVTITVMRGSKKMKIKLTLASRDQSSPDNMRTNMQNNMGSTPSSRRKNFPMCFQHDSMLTATTCGGPIADLSGKVVGVNIARGGRVSSLSLPADVVLPVIAELKTGKLAPEIVNKDRIKAIDLELKEIEKLLGGLPSKKIVLERKYNVERARAQELDKTMDDLKKRIKLIEAKSKKYKSELDIVRSQLRKKAETREQLEADRQQLVTGSR
ncbi:MAG: PDZ domain-containing protein [Mariniblastus sp.]